VNVEQHTAVKKIRKLLRLAKTPGPEGANAAERARELMEKHGLREVRLEDKVRLLVAGAGESLWCEQVLAAIAGTFGCRVVENTRGAKRELALSGDRTNVSAAIENYRRIVKWIADQSMSSWRANIVAWSNYNRPEVEVIWHRVFHFGAADAIAARLAAAVATTVETISEDEPETAPPQSDSSTPESPVSGAVPEEAAAPAREVPRESTDSRVDVERAKSASDMQVMMHAIGELESRYVYRIAWQNGRTTGDQAEIHHVVENRLALGGRVGR
jgi:hypothetical protein